MLSTAYYFLQVIFCSAIMMTYYVLVLRNRRFHQYNRFYLIAVALVSWIIPLIKIEWTRPKISDQQIGYFLSVIADNNSSMDAALAVNPTRWNWDGIAAMGYCVVSTTLLFLMIRALYRLFKLLSIHSCRSIGNVHLILTRADGTPFSFFKYIFWNEDIDIRSPEGKKILEHELAHVQQKHSVDKLLIQLILVIGWFNPIFWILKREMEMIHEFMADKKAIANGDTALLAQMLLTTAYPKHRFTLVHPFFFSPLQRRFYMLTNSRIPKLSYVRRIVVLPLLGIITIFFAFRISNSNNNKLLFVQTAAKSLMKSILPESADLDITTKTRSNLPKQEFAYNQVRFVPELENTIIRTGKTPLKTMESIELEKQPLQMELATNTIRPVNLLFKTDADIPYNRFERETVLVVIDGEKVNSDLMMKNLPSSAIQSISFTKDTGAQAIYGDEAKRGVINVALTALGNAEYRLFREFKKNNPAVVSVKRRVNKITIALNDGAEEIYEVNNPISVRIGESKYGKLPILEESL